MFSVKKISLVIGLVAVVAAAVFIGRQSGGESTDNTLLITPRAVERRDLSDVLTVSGEVRRDETKKINSAVDGKVSQINVEDGDTVEIGDGVFALDGRTAVAVPGEFSFYRELTVGSVGPDVKQLETILNDSGYKIRDIDTLFTEDTRTALANWQFDRGYSGSSNENDETITASLSPNGAAYSVGRENTAAFVVTQAVPTSGGSSIRPMVSKPTLNISADKSTVAEGSAVTFTITSDVAPYTDLTIAINIGGSATPGDDPVNDDDYDTILGSAIIKAGELSTSFTSNVFVDNTIEDEEDITVAMTTQFGNDPTYALGNTNQLRVVIPANGSELRPLLTVKASSETISEGSTVTFTVRTSVKSNRDIKFNVTLTGNASPDVDFLTPNTDSYTIFAGNYSVDVQIQIRRDDTVEPDENLILTLGADTPPSGKAERYFLGGTTSADVTIESGDLPELKLVGGGTVAEGRTGSFRIVADSPLTDDTSVNYQLSGTAQNGADYKALSGTVIMKAGSSSVTVAINVINDDVTFKPSDMLVADWPARIGKVEVDEGEFVLQGNVVLSLTEPQFTITMKVSPTDRAELELGQAVSVDLKVGGQILPGTISELDDSATVGGAGEELYEGTITVTGEFSAVDGATVSIDVTLDEALQVLAVPVAAVLRSADGDEVRIVNDAGTITRVKVTIGLIDGEWVEIQDGLKGDELVVVDIASGNVATDA
jgi:multidrug efflux pump subunit AcrA (membrane-fusion protein)